MKRLNTPCTQCGKLRGNHYGLHCGCHYHGQEAGRIATTCFTMPGETPKPHSFARERMMDRTIEEQS